MQVDATNNYTHALHDALPISVTLNTGSHTVGEAAGSVGDPSDYQKSIVCKNGDHTVASTDGDTAGPLDVAVHYGDAIVCTIKIGRASCRERVDKQLAPDTVTDHYD